MTKEAKKELEDCIGMIKKLDYFIETTDEMLKNKSFILSTPTGREISFINNSGIGMNVMLKAITKYNFDCKFYKEELKKKAATLLYET